MASLRHNTLVINGLRFCSGLLRGRKPLPKYCKNASLDNFNPTLVQYSILNVGLFFVNFVPRGAPRMSPNQRDTFTESHVVLCQS